MKTLHKRCAGLDVHKGGGSGLPARCHEQESRARGAPFPDHDTGIIGACRVAGECRMHTCGDGSDWRVLETGLAYSRRTFCVDLGECGTREERAWAKE